MNNFTLWHDLQPHINELKSIAKDRDDQKGSYVSTKNWSIRDSTHFLGLCGEKIFEIETGLTLDSSLNVLGDNGYDFEKDNVRYDIKCASHWSSPDLKEFINAKQFVEMYILVAVDIRNERAKLIGWATGEQLKAANRKNYGHGEMLSITRDELKSLGQLGLPPQFLAEKVKA